MADVNEFLSGIGFECRKRWVDDNDGVVSNFPVRCLLDFLRGEGMIHIDSFRDGDKIVHNYKFGIEDVIVCEFPGRITTLVLEFDGFKFKEEVKA